MCKTDIDCFDLPRPTLASSTSFECSMPWLFSVDDDDSNDDADLM